MFAFLALLSESRSHRHRLNPLVRRTRTHNIAFAKNDADDEARMEAMIQFGLSMQGKNTYTQSSLRTQVFETPGYSDCSSFCWKMYERFFGIYVGSWTGEQVTKGTQVVQSSGGAYNKVSASEMALLKPGDLLFYGGGSAQHVEMYIGNGQQLGHGSGMGPTLKNTLEYSHAAGFYQARRYVDVEDTSFQSVGTCTCNADGVRIRSTPWGTILGQVNSGTEMQYDGTTNQGWYHVKVNGLVGYMHPDYITFSTPSYQSE